MSDPIELKTIREMLSSEKTEESWFNLIKYLWHISEWSIGQACLDYVSEHVSEKYTIGERIAVSFESPLVSRKKPWWIQFEHDEDSHSPFNDQVYCIEFDYNPYHKNICALFTHIDLYDYDMNAIPQNESFWSYWTPKNGSRIFSQEELMQIIEYRNNFILLSNIANCQIITFPDQTEDLLGLTTRNTAKLLREIPSKLGDTVSKIRFIDEQLFIEMLPNNRVGVDSIETWRQAYKNLEHLEISFDPSIDYQPIAGVIVNLYNTALWYDNQPDINFEIKLMRGKSESDFLKLVEDMFLLVHT